MSVNADKLVRILPRIIGGGTPGLTFAGLALTTSDLPPAQRVLQFSSAQAVGDYFGLASDEYAFALQYFSGYINATSLPDKLFFARYNSGSVTAWLRGADFAGRLSDLTSVTSGGLDITIDGKAYSLSAVSLASATSFSEVAAALQTALAAQAGEGETPTVMYSSLTGAFQINATTAGREGSISYATPPTGGTDLATLLGLTEATGAVISQGADAQTLTSAMTNTLQYARDWVTFTTIFEATLEQKLELARWCAGYDTRFCYVMWDTDPAALQNSEASAARQINALDLAGTSPNYNNLALAAFAMGFAASLNFDETNGRATAAYKRGEGLGTTVHDDEQYDQLLANGYNVYADFATASADFRFYQPGSVTGDWMWLDTYLNAIALKDALQLNLLDLLSAVKAIPYTEQGYSMVRTACLDTITRFLTFGAIRPGVTLSNTQKIALRSEIGFDVSKTIEQQGWYMLVRDPGSVVRGQRGTPECRFYYTDGGSIQRIEMTATAIQ